MAPLAVVVVVVVLVRVDLAMALAESMFCICCCVTGWSCNWISGLSFIIVSVPFGFASLLLEQPEGPHFVNTCFCHASLSDGT